MSEQNEYVEPTTKVVLVGPHAGKSIKLGRYRFTNGAINIPTKDVSAIRFVGRFYSAFPEDSTELAKERAKLRAVESDVEEPATEDAPAKRGRKPSR